MLGGRRRFLQACGALGGACVGGAAEAAGGPGESAVGELVRSLRDSLSPEQRRELVLPFGDERRGRVDANFAVTEPRLGSRFYSPAQRGLVERLVRAQLSEPGWERIRRQMKGDAGGLSGYHIAFFESAAGGGGDTHWLLTGRHLMLRASARRGSELGGCRVYGHGEEAPRASLFHYQTVRAAALYGALDEGQRSRALLEEAPFEEEVQLGAAGKRLSGLPVAALSSDQRPLLTRWVQSLSELLEPRLARLVEQRLWAASSAAAVRVTFYREDDLGDDGQWDLWRLQGPGVVWHFRGAPHVHAYLNLA